MAMTLIADNSADTTDLTSISFTSGIDSTYDEYMFVIININPAEDERRFEFNASDDTSSWSYDIVKTTAVFSSWHSEADSTDGLSYETGDDLAASTAYQKIMHAMEGFDADSSGCGILHLFAPSSTTYAKNFYLRTISVHSDPRATDYFVAGYFNTTAAITALEFKMSSGNFDGLIQMYGIA